MKYLEDVFEGKVIDRYYIDKDGVIVSQKHPNTSTDFTDELNVMIEECGMTLEEVAKHFSNAYSQLMVKESDSLPSL